jgi:hypothetical protein
MNDEIVSCIPLKDGPYLVAVTKSGKVFIGFLRSGSGPEIVWERATDIPIKI